MSVAIAISVFYDRYKRWKRSRQLRDPFEIDFLIPRVTEYKIGYYPQNDKIHRPKTLTLPSNSEHDVMIRMVPRCDLVLNELQFGCLGEIKSKPEPLHHFNPYIKEGKKRETHPDKSTTHYKDYNNYYHMEFRGKICHKDDPVITGLRMKTKEKGIFCFWASYAMPERVAESRVLTMRIE